MDEINWDDLYLQLYAYTDQLLKSYSWFRKGKTDSFLKGKQPYDYIADAIEKYLLEPEKYDSSSGRSLLNYLKWHIIRTAVGNDVRSSENKSTIELASKNDPNSEREENLDVESLFPFIAANFDDEIDYKHLMKEIEEKLADDELSKLIFSEVRRKGFDRKDVIKNHKVSEKEFDNGMKRLNRILKNIAKEYNYE
jgi:hypothetical protein